MNKTTKLLGLAVASLLAACSNQAAPAETTQATTAQATTVQATTQAPATTATNTTVATNASEDAMGSQNAMQKEIVDAFKKEFPNLDITALEYTNGMFYEVEAMNDTNEYTYRYDKSAKTFMKLMKQLQIKKNMMKKKLT